MAQNPLVERNIGFDAAHLILAQRAAHAQDRLDPIFAPGNQLGDHRIVIDRHLGAFVNAAVVAQAQPFGQAQAFDLARAGHEIVLRVLGINAALDGMAGLRDMALAPRQIAARRDLDLRFDQIDADHPFGHRMLDLQARVHFEKIKILLLIQQKLQGSGADVADRARALDGDTADAPPGAVVQSRRRRFFDDFLMAPLDRAFAIVEMNDMAVVVGENLNFDMARFLDKLLDVQPRIAEG